MYDRKNIILNDLMKFKFKLRLNYALHFPETQFEYILFSHDTQPWKIGFIFSRIYMNWKSIVRANSL